MNTPHRWPLLTSAVAILALLLAALTPAAVPRAAAAGSLQLSRGMAAPGDSVSVSGAGFTPSDTVVVIANFNVNGSTQQVQNATHVNGNGTFSTGFTVPAGAAPGDYKVTAKDFHGVVTTQTLTVLHLISLQVGAGGPTVYIIAGHSFYAQGRGFKGGETVVLKAVFPLYNGNPVTVSKTVGTDTKGTFGETLLQVPNGAKAGAVTLTGTGEQSQKKATATLHPTYQPAISLSASTVRPGGTITVSGRGYVPGATVRVAVTIPRTSGGAVTLSAAANADQNGNFSASLVVPANTQPSTYTVEATDLAGGFKATAQVLVSVKPGITIQPGAVSPGNRVLVSGGGYSAGVQVTVSATFPLYGGGTRTVSTTATTNGNGQFQASLVVPGNAAAGGVTIAAAGPHGRSYANLQVNRIAAGISVSPSSVIPGSSVTIKGSGYPANDRVSISVTVTLANGSSRTLTTSATANGSGQFSVSLGIPGDVAGGSFTVVARSAASGRAPTARLTVAKLAPSVVAVPTTAAPGTPVTVNGFGFASGATVTLTLQGQRVGSATADASGKFSTKFTVPSGLATGSYTITATSSNGRTARIALAVNRQVATHYYFAAFYTGRGYHEYLTFLNPSAIQARVTITYQLTTGRNHAKALTLAAHTRATEDVNADLGYHVSSGAVVAADVPIAVARVVFHNSDMAIVPGATSPATAWYFADGNTSKNYREFLAIENPNSGAVQVAVHFLPTHHPAFTIYRTVPAATRTTVKVNSFVHKDAVGVTVTASGPIVVNRSIFIHHGTTSKIGVTAPQRTWYFAAGPANGAAHNWIGAINPTGQRAYVTLHAYGPQGSEIGTVSGWLRPYARVGYLINRIAGQPDAAVVLTSSAPIVAEETTYVARMHDASTDTFGAASPGKSWAFAAVNTGGGQSDVLSLFNPSLNPIPVVVQFITASGGVTQRTYVVAPLAHVRVDVGSVVPNAQLGIVAASNDPFVALNRAFANNGLASDTSIGIPM